MTNILIFSSLIFKSNAKHVWQLVSRGKNFNFNPLYHKSETRKFEIWPNAAFTNVAVEAASASKAGLCSGYLVVSQVRAFEKVTQRKALKDATA